MRILLPTDYPRENDTVQTKDGVGVVVSATGVEITVEIEGKCRRVHGVTAITAAPCIECGRELLGEKWFPWKRGRMCASGGCSER